jgi:dipeptidase E
MKLVMLSQQFDPTDRVIAPRVAELLRDGRGRVAYLPSAPDPERAWFEPQLRCYAALGISLKYFGLEQEFDAERVDELLDMDAIHLSGGNTFRFMHWLRTRDMTKVIRDYVAAGGTLIGVSAGAIIMTPDIGTASLCGDQRMPGVEGDAGLDLVEFVVVPHFTASETSRAGLPAVARRYRRDVYAIPDGAAVVVTDNHTQTLGPVTVVDCFSSPLSQ